MSVVCGVETDMSLPDMQNSRAWNHCFTNCSKYQKLSVLVDPEVSCVLVDHEQTSKSVHQVTAEFKSFNCLVYFFRSLILKFIDVGVKRLVVNLRRVDLIGIFGVTKFSLHFLHKLSQNFKTQSVFTVKFKFDIGN